MSDIAIRVENQSKLYRIGAAQQRHDTLRDGIADLGCRIANLTKRNSQFPVSHRPLGPQGCVV